MMRRLRNLMICLVLAAASLHGVKVRPEDVEKLMEAMNKRKVAHSLSVEQQAGDDIVKRGG
jgi:hypothetical protein